MGRPRHHRTTIKSRCPTQCRRSPQALCDSGRPEPLMLARTRVARAAGRTSGKVRRRRVLAGWCQLSAVHGYAGGTLTPQCADRCSALACCRHCPPGSLAERRAAGAFENAARCHRTLALPQVKPAPRGTPDFAARGPRVGQEPVASTFHRKHAARRTPHQGEPVCTHRTHFAPLPISWVSRA